MHTVTDYARGAPVEVKRGKSIQVVIWPRWANFPPRSAAVDLDVYLTLATVEENTATARSRGESV